MEDRENAQVLYVLRNSDGDLCSMNREQAEALLSKERWEAQEEFGRTYEIVTYKPMGTPR